MVCELTYLSGCLIVESLMRYLMCYVLYLQLRVLRMA